MKIQTLLNEEFAANTPAQKLRFSDLNTLQVRTLLRIANGEVDVDSASEKEYDIITDLHDLGLLDDEYALAPRGLKAVEVANQLGGSAELVAARDKQGKLDSGAADRAADDIEAGVGVEVDAVPNGNDSELPPVDDDEEFDFGTGTQPQNKFSF